MEIHSHSHIPTSRGKKWTHYFWEFFMLFLAVTAGFFVENQREHYIEHKREKQYIASMLNDIRSDTAVLTQMHYNFSRVVLNIDSLIPLLKSGELDKNATRIYQHQVMLNLFQKWVYADRTISQLKNSGNFRLIRNKAVSDEIMDYDGYVINYVGEMQDLYILPMWGKMNDIGSGIFKMGVFREFFNSGGWKYHPVHLPDPPYFISTDKDQLQKFINLMDQYAIAIQWANANMKKAVSMGVSLDSLIRKEYQIK